MLKYNQQYVYDLLGSKSAVSAAPENADPSFVITGATLTAAYSGNVSKTLPNPQMSQMCLNIKYVAGTNATALGLKIEWSADNAKYAAPVNWFQETVEQVGVGTSDMYLQERSFTNNSSLVGGTAYSFEIKLPIARRFSRISAKETLSSGTSFGTIFVEGVVTAF